MNFVDLVVIFLILLGIYAEASRGLFYSLFDLLRIALALGMGLAGYALAAKLFRSYAAGLVGFVILALFVVLLLAALLRRSRIDPEWGKRTWARVSAGLVGAGIGFAVALVLVPAIGRMPGFQPGVERAILARPALRMMTRIPYAADVLNIEIPQLNRRPIRFEDEGDAGAPVFTERVNFLRLAGSMCIACRAPVEFLGYKLRPGLQVSPKFQCPNCGRTSDGCQTFEGFHALYHRCPVEVAHGRIAIDCGVWPNNRDVQPTGECPVCGRIGQPGQGGPRLR